MELFPYTLRKNQNNIMQDITNNLIEGNDFVFESGTGSGKTICALSSTIAFALQHDKNHR